VDVTLNPDFNQVESDQPQVTVNQRFEVFFPEKRPFFLENANFFRSPFNLVFTRRIADPQFGVRLTGKTGPYALGFMLMDDEAPGKRVPTGDPLHDRRAVFGIARISRDIFQQSNIGLIYTDREFEGSYNRVGGADGRIKFNQNWTTGFQGVFSTSKPLEGSSRTGSAFSLQVDRSGRQLNTHTHYQEISPDFRTRVGFVPRTDFRDFHNFISYSFRPEKKFLISWGPEFFVQRLWDYDGTRLDESIEGSLEWQFTGQTHFEVNYLNRRERLRPVDFPILQGDKDFNTNQWVIEFETSFVDEFRVESDVGWGNTINFVPVARQEPHPADMLAAELEVNLQPITPFRIDNDYIFFQLNDEETGDQILKNQILRSRWNWQFNRKLSLRLIFQYDVTQTNSA
ncbi:hypothetical protein GWO43_02285, partial [candidate division KSB1 bacterium]|nr:hypothetical protein [candidate division KSB1 bacterium]NIR69693.1 hypothetical protein [candidate division KSB1 bacterium]NIS24889.1 hypothetical protein [candidate division KSB1 bacterium]NIT69738.1 hypothetical protein [candidate division KSB1 bacterium]NIU23408.1 hypothetical protein [candidate division KSB1 bacterium]